MRIVLLTSTSSRHAYMAQRLREHFDLALVVREQKGLKEHYRNHPDRELIEAHFTRLADTEKAFFGACEWEETPEVETVARGEMNTERLADRIRLIGPEAVAVFGCGIIKAPVLDVLPEGKTFNIHQGLSPYYRGGGTNFWPFVYGELQYIGVTLHRIDAGIDTGKIIAHERPDIEASDNQHTLGCKTIVKSADLLVRVLQCVRMGHGLDAVPQWGEGKTFRRADLTGNAIREVYRRENEGFVAEFVKKRDSGKTRPLQLIRLEA